MAERSPIRLPRQWSEHVKSGVLQSVAAPVRDTFSTTTKCFNRSSLLGVPQKSLRISAFNSVVHYPVAHYPRPSN